jgi:hypothetical protein
MACRSGCRTQDHSSYAACLKAASITVDPRGTIQALRDTATELNAYKAARDAGIQPAGTRMHAIDAANRISDKYSAPFNAENGTVGGVPPALKSQGITA